MMELSPEMVAVIFHQGLKFTQPAVMDDLLSHEGDELPDWSTLADGIELAQGSLFGTPAADCRPTHSPSRNPYNPLSPNGAHP